jgi:hypothetical protein
MIDSINQGFGCYVIHFSPLRERRSFLEKALSGVRTDWVTESDVIVESYPWRNSDRVFGVSRRMIASDLGINARSLSRSRRQATYESYVYRFASLFGKRFKKVSFGSLPNDARLPRNILELNVMHIHAVLLFIQDNKEWGLFLEDDSVFSQEGLKQVSVISKEKKLKPTWINLNDGAGLARTSSEKTVNEAGLFRVKPPATKCASAYVINREYALRLKDLIMVHGIPDWLPIDVLYQVANRKMHAESYWSEPIRFIQGSSSGIYKSSLESLRIRE